MGFMPSSFLGLPSVSQTFLGLKEAGKDRDAQRDANNANIASAREAEKWSSSEAQKQMDFQERMSGSSHQREVTDLQKAGLNPLLSVNSGASSPSGSMGSGYTSVSEALPSEFKGMAAIAGSGREVLNMLQNMQESQSRIGLNSDLGRKARADAGLADTSAKRMSSEAYIEGMKKDYLEKFMNSAKSWWNEEKKHLGSPWSDDRNRSLKVVPGNGPDKGLTDLYGPGGYE